MRDYSRELEFIQTIKKFGEEEYGLNFKGAFEDVDLGEFSCNWAYACPVDKLESVFNNKRPYEFYPDQDKAWKRYMQLKNAGNDSYFYHAEAHGGGNCPITRDMLEASGARQCYVIIHEAWHTTSKAEKLEHPYPFEESSGRVIGLFGGIELAEKLNDSNLLEATVNQEAAWSMFADFVNKVWDELQEFYSSNPAMEAIKLKKAEFNKRGAELAAELPDSWEKMELSKEINNAFILRYHDYTVYYPHAKRIYNMYGNLAETIRHYKTHDFGEMIGE